MEALGSLMAQLHAWVATAAAVLAGAVLLIAIPDAAGLVTTRRLQDGLSVALFAALLGAVLLGPGIVVGVGPPSDPTHYVYAAAALGAVPLGRLVAVRRGRGRVSWWVAGGALVTLLALLRLWATGV